MSRSHKSRIFIGDVHGCATELLDLLELLQFDPAAHALYFVGDLVNRGPRSLDALRLAIEVGADSVLGNHDLHLLGRAAATRSEKELDTLDEILRAPDRDDLLNWLRARPVILTWDDLTLVHAGLHPAWNDLQATAARIEAAIDWKRDPFEQQDLRFATSVRHCDAEGNRAPRSLEGNPTPPPPWEPWYEWYKGTRTVVFGHWATRGIVSRDRLRGLDSGCVWGGRLTAWIAEQDRHLSVPARRIYQQADS